jgi:hypothetical protein
MKRAFSARLCVLIAVFMTAFILPALPARADLLIMPIRIYFLGRERMQDMTLVNTSDKAATFRIGWRHQRQVETGGYRPQEEPLNPDYNPEDLIVFSPRQVTLPPGGKQRVRMSLRRPPEMPDGEYRAHIQLQRIGEVSRKVYEDEKSGVSMGLAVNVGFAVPVVIRQGAYNAAAKLSAPPRFIPAGSEGRQKPTIEFSIDRSGDFSTIGNIAILWSGPGQSEKEIGRLNGVNIYPELTRRIVRIPLNTDSIPAGTIRILYEGDGPDKGVTFINQSFPVGG